MKFKYLFLTLIVAFFLSSSIIDDPSLKVGSSAPEIKVLSENTVEKHLVKESKETLVSFWSPKNPSSRIRNRQYLDFLKSHPELEIEFVSICIDRDDFLANEVRRKDGINAGSLHLNYNQVEERIFKDYGVEESPRAFLIGKDGSIKSIAPETRELL